MTVRYLTGRNSTARVNIFAEIKQALHSGTENRLIYWFLINSHFKPKEI